MNLFELTLLNYLRSGKLKMELTGFDLDGFDRAMHRELSSRLDVIECVIFEDSETSTDAEIKRLFEEEFPV